MVQRSDHAGVYNKKIFHLTVGQFREPAAWGWTNPDPDTEAEAGQPGKVGKLGRYRRDERCLPE